jgi:uncharacterized membrane protein
MGFDACGERGPESVCDYAVADLLWPGELVGIAVFTAAVLVWAAVRARRGRRIWWLPLVATAATIALTISLVLTVYRMINLSPFDA